MIEKVWHIGSLKKGEKGVGGSSYEGNLLSVSPCPEAWQQICRMGGKELYQSSRAVKMLDMNTILYSQDAQAERLRKHIIKEGKASGSIVKRDMWKASYYDDELDKEVYTLFDSLDALREEYPDGEYVEVSRESGHFSSKDVLLKHGWSADGIQGIDFAIIEW